jgi:hypothetical protein
MILVLDANQLANLYRAKTNSGGPLHIRSGLHPKFTMCGVRVKLFDKVPSESMSLWDSVCDRCARARERCERFSVAQPSRVVQGGEP